MGNTDSIPVVSQVKSLVQVIGGDEEGARKTQENFLETGLVASQVNSAILAINGHQKEARELQEQFLRVHEPAVDALPVIGHAKAAVHAALGDEEKAREVALGATKSTVVAVSAAAGAVCGPAAPACGAGLAAGSLALWDGVDSAVAGEERGIIAGVGDLARGEATIGEGFDTVFGVGAAAAGGAIGAKAVAKSVARPNAKLGSGLKVSSSLADDLVPLCRRRRSVDQGSKEFFDPYLSTVQVGSLPPMLGNTKLDSLSTLTMNPNNLAMTLMSIFTVLKLMAVKHPRSKPYYEEICAKIYPQEPILECEERLFGMLSSKNDHFSPKPMEKPAIETLFETSFMTLRFEMQNLVQQTELGTNMTKAVCLVFHTHEETGACLSTLSHVFSRLKREFKQLDGERIRRKRAIVFNCRSSHLSNKFQRNHVLNTVDFDDIHGNVKSGKAPTFAQAESLFNQRPRGGEATGMKMNTWLRDGVQDDILLKGGTIRQTGSGVVVTPDTPFVDIGRTPDLRGYELRAGKGTLRTGTDFGDGGQKVPGTAVSTDGHVVIKTHHLEKVQAPADMSATRIRVYPDHYEVLDGPSGQWLPRSYPANPQ